MPPTLWPLQQSPGAAVWEKVAWRLKLKVHAMESNPLDKDLAGHMLEITLFSARIYADINDSSEIWLCDPVSPAHVRLYQGKGFTPYYDRFDRCTHLMRKIR